MLLVKNTNNFVLTDSFDGVRLTFPINEKVPISEDAARFIFGYGHQDKMPVLVRQGWCKITSDQDSAMKILGHFVFSNEDEKKDDEVVTLRDMIPEDTHSEDLLMAEKAKNKIISRLRQSGLEKRG